MALLFQTEKPRAMHGALPADLNPPSTFVCTAVPGQLLGCFPALSLCTLFLFFNLMGHGDIRSAATSDEKGRARKCSTAGKRQHTANKCESQEFNPDRLAPLSLSAGTTHLSFHYKRGNLRYSNRPLQMVTAAMKLKDAYLILILLYQP